MEATGRLGLHSVAQGPHRAMLLPGPAPSQPLAKKTKQWGTKAAISAVIVDLTKRKREHLL